MAHRSITPSRLFALVLAVVSALATVAFTSAAEPLRWKFAPGQKLTYELIQGTKAGGMNMQQTMLMNWNVEQVDDQGNATIRQSFTRVKMNVEMPGIPAIAYDSDNPEPTGPAAMMDPMFRALIDHAVQVTMTPRGEIRKVDVPDAMIEALKNSPGAGSMGKMGSKEGIQEVLAQASLTLPEETPADGAEWSNTVEMDHPVGKQTVETTYKYIGTRDVGGDTMAVIKPSVKMSIAGLNVKDQQTSGEILFNQSEGRLNSQIMHQDVTFEIPMGEQTVEQKVQQKMEIKVTEADESVAEPAPVE